MATKPRRALRHPKSEDQRKRDLFTQLKSWFELEHSRQHVNRYQMALDTGYVDGDQWLPHEAAEVRRRGQNPIVINEVKPTIDWLKGTERRTRRDFKVLPRKSNTPEAQDDAEVKTKLLKYLDDVNRSPFERSQAFDDAVRAGLGWLETGITSDPEDEPIYVRHESWRNMLHDSISTTRMDLQDSRYLFRFKEIDLDIAEAYFPEHAEALQRACFMGDVRSTDDDDWAGAWPVQRTGSSEVPMRWISYNAEADAMNPRKRVALVECWYRTPTKETTGQGGSSMDRTRLKVRVAIFTKHELLLDSESPYSHNRFPFVPVWCYRRAADGLPYGVVRNIRGPQDALNKRTSKAEFLLSVNQLRLEKGAVDNDSMTIDELRDEAAAPDGVMIFANGALSGGKVQTREHGDLAQGHVALAERYAASIRSVAGVTLENRGESSASASGKAIIAKQDQGAMVTAEIFDNALLAHQLEGELIISLIEQFYTEEKTFAVTGERFKLDYVTINQPDPVTGELTNDVTQHKASFVIGEAPWRQTLAAAAFESAMQMLGQLAPVAPQVVTAIIDLVFEWSDLPNKNEILRRIREATGMPDPDEGESPEQAQAKQQKAEMEKAQFDAQMAQLQAVIREAQAKGEKLEADAMAKRLEALYMAAQGAQVLTIAPQIAPVADELARSAGFQDMAGDGALNGAVPTEPAPPIPEPMQADGALAGGMQGSITPEADGIR